MENHIYSFAGEFRKQSKGGAIGNVLTGSLGAFCMVIWSRGFKKNLDYAMTEITTFKQFLIKIYVDDGNQICTTLPLGLGSRLINGKVRILEDKIEEDRNIPGDIRTANIITEIGNSVCNFIVLTVDTPSSNSSGWMPILDLQVRVSSDVVEYKFYKKVVTTLYLILSRSALPTKIKWASLVHEGVRRLLNTRRQLDWDTIKADILTEFSWALKISGYTEKFRLDVIQAAIVSYER